MTADERIDKEKVIKGLKCLAQMNEPMANPCRECGYIDRPNFAFCVKNIASDALALLKEQEAVEPVVDVDTWACGNCNYPVERDRLIGPNALLNERYNYCPNCGKKVKWNE